MQGQPFNALQNYFPDGTPIGLLNVRSGACHYNPDASTIVQTGEACGTVRVWVLGQGHGDAYRESAMAMQRQRRAQR